jgi:hypothetical protein
MPDALTLNATAILRALPQVGRVIIGQPQPMILSRVVAHDLKCFAHLGQIMDALLARSLSREEEDEADVLLEYLVLEWERKKAARRAQQPPCLVEASLAEEAANHALNVAQLRLTPDPSLSVLHALRDCGMRQIARTKDLVLGAHVRLQEWT